MQTRETGAFFGGKYQQIEFFCWLLCVKPIALCPLCHQRKKTLCQKNENFGLRFGLRLILGWKYVSNTTHILLGTPLYTTNTFADFWARKQSPKCPLCSSLQQKKTCVKKKLESLDLDLD